MSALWRLFIPTWRFYDRVGLAPELWLLRGGEWQKSFEKPPIHWYTLFFNPGGNLHFARENLLERLLLEIPGTARPVSHLVTYQLMKQLAVDVARERELGYVRQFKISARGEDVVIGDL